MVNLNVNHSLQKLLTTSKYVKATTGSLFQLRSLSHTFEPYWIHYAIFVLLECNVWARRSQSNHCQGSVQLVQKSLSIVPGVSAATRVWVVSGRQEVGQY
jgi:hypothetical protein